MQNEWLARASIRAYKGMVKKLKDSKTFGAFFESLTAEERLYFCSLEFSGMEYTEDSEDEILFIVGKKLEGMPRYEMRSDGSLVEILPEEDQ